MAESKKQFIKRVVKDVGTTALNYRNAYLATWDDDTEEVMITYLVGRNGYEVRKLSELPLRDINMLAKSLEEDFE